MNRALLFSIFATTLSATKAPTKEWVCSHASYLATQSALSPAVRRYMQHLASTLQDDATPRALRSFTSRCLDEEVEEPSLTVDELLTLIKEESIDIHLKATSHQLTIKRIALFTITEILGQFGYAKLWLETCLEKRDQQLVYMRENTRSNHTQAFADQIARQVQQQWRTRKKYPWKRRFLRNYHALLGRNTPTFFLRTLWTLGDMAADAVVPNPHAAQEETYAELIFPPLIAYAVMYYISNNRSESLKAMSYAWLNDTSMRLLWSQLYMAKTKIWPWIIWVITQLLIMSWTPTSYALWYSLSDDPQGINDHWSHWKKLMLWHNLKEVLFDALIYNLFYKIVDEKLMVHVTLPDWFSPESVCCPVRSRRHSLPESCRQVIQILQPRALGDH